MYLYISQDFILPSACAVLNVEIQFENIRLYGLRSNSMVLLVKSITAVGTYSYFLSAMLSCVLARILIVQPISIFKLFWLHIYPSAYFIVLVFAEATSVAGLKEVRNSYKERLNEISSKPSMRETAKKLIVAFKYFL
jgi:hypothetical protein